jgi:signal transduction histidine kinase
MSDAPLILIIDDEQIVRDSCKRILAKTEFEVVTASSGSRGLDLVEERRPDLVVVDLKMPGISGFEVLERIEKFDPTIVTIVITGYATVSSAVEAMKKGAFDFLPKPFTPDEFRLIVRRALEKRRLVLETIALRREKEMLREHFAAIVSHELKSPLGAVQQNLYVLQKSLADRLSEDEARRLERMRQRIDDLMKLIQTWLRAVSMDFSGLEERFAAVSAALIVGKAVESVEPHAARKDVAIRTDVAPDAGEVFGDEVTLVEALVNILTNAVRYSQMGSSVDVTARREGDQVVLAVTDEGVGIDEQDLPFVFEDFFRGDAGRSGTDGSGIGLGVTRRIVEAHGGAVEVESKLGEGSTFRLRLPAATGQEG